MMYGWHVPRLTPSLSLCLSVSLCVRLFKSHLKTVPFDQMYVCKPLSAEGQRV